MADPGFPRGGGANPPGWGRQHTILPNVPKNCMKLKEFGPRWGGIPRAPLDPPLRDHQRNNRSALLEFFLITSITKLPFLPTTSGHS